MASSAPKHILLTGAPGCGKTTIILAVLRRLRRVGRPTFGFWTEEVRQSGVRQGFALELVSGGRDMLASVRRSGPPRVGRYGVNVEAMDRFAVPEIERGLAAAKAKSGVVIVMDEIGKMELFSRSFQQAAIAALDSPARVVATIMARPHPFADSLKARSDVRVVTVTRQNRDELARQIAEMLGIA